MTTNEAFDKIAQRICRYHKVELRVLTIILNQMTQFSHDAGLTPDEWISAIDILYATIHYEEGDEN
jgi:hypothetical protein